MTEQRKPKELSLSQQLPTPEDSRVLSNNESFNEEQTDQFNSDDYIQDQAPKIVIPKENMKSLFTKLASNGHLRTLKDKSINPDSLLLRDSNTSNTNSNNAAKEMKIFDSKINIDEYIMNDPNLLLTDTFINRVNSSGSPNKRQDENYPFEVDSYKAQSNDSITKNSSIDYSVHMSSGNTNINNNNNNNNNNTNVINNTNHNTQFNLNETSRPLMTEVSNSNGNSTNKGVTMNQKRSNPNIKSQSTNMNSNVNNNNNPKGLQSTRTPTKPMTTKHITNGKKNMPMQNNKQTIPSSSSKKDIALNSNTSNTNIAKGQMKRKVNSPSIQMMSSNKKTKQKQSVVSNMNINGTNTEMNVIEEYDYNKILSDLKAIFGDNLEYFDENYEATNKGLIKGLLMLSYFQEKKLKTMNENINKAKMQFREELNRKDNLIEEMSHDMSNMNANLKNLILDTEKYTNISNNNKKVHNGRLSALFDKCK